MSLQDVFYIVAIIALSLWTLLLIFILVGVFYLKRKITETVDRVEARFENIKSIVVNTREAATAAGVVVAGAALKKAANFVKSWKKKRK